MRRRRDEDDASYEWFFRDEFPRVVKTVYLIVRDSQTAEDIAQEAFARLLVHWAKVSRYEQPDAWVRRIAIRMAVRANRRAWIRSRVEGVVEPPVQERPQDVDLMRAITSLPGSQRAAIVLFYYEDQPTAQIAEILGCSESTARVHLHKARRRLARVLDRSVIDAP
ncbi:MAG: sigma-70 family RNA polymerase sigma factor [Actinomycetota bacterium]|nr:sigma-70 family RNA polymerase sigma factor [Actinomycetota bacterium]